MTEMLSNPWRGTGLPGAGRHPSDDSSEVGRLLSRCPAHRPTPLVDLSRLAKRLGVARLQAKDERQRMGLGSFKVLGAAYAIARETAERVEVERWSEALSGRAFVTASAGNHGLSVAAGARVFGARAVIYLAETVPEAFAERHRAKGAEVVRAGATYEDSMAAAKAAAERSGTLLSDSSWPGYEELPQQVMEGYLQLVAEGAGQLNEVPTHVVVQAGVGGLAAAVAAWIRAAWGDGPTVVVVEPEAAPALLESIQAGRSVTAEGPVSSMGRLDCKTPSMIALAGLSRDADLFVALSEEEAALGVADLAAEGVETTPSGAAGIGALFAGRPALPDDARVLAIVTEGAEVG